MTMQTSVASDEPYVPGRPRSDTARKLLLYGIVVVVAALFFVPFLWTITTSFKTIPDSVNVTVIPHPWSTDAWHTLWTRFDFPTYIKNSLFLCAVIVPCNLFLSALGGYAFARLRFPGRELLFWLVLGTLMVPDQLRLVPVFLMIVHWGLFGSFWGYIMINLASAVNLFFMRQYFLTIPKDFEEAAKLDGAGYFKTFWRVMLPLALPARGAPFHLSHRCAARHAAPGPQDEVVRALVHSCAGKIDVLRLHVADPDATEKACRVLLRSAHRSSRSNNSTTPANGASRRRASGVPCIREMNDRAFP